MQFVGHLLAQRASQFWPQWTQEQNDLYQIEMERAGSTCRCWRTGHRDEEYDKELDRLRKERTALLLKRFRLTIAVVGDSERGGPCDSDWEEAWELLGNPEHATVGSFSVFAILVASNGDDKFVGPLDLFEGEKPSEEVPNQIERTGESLDFLGVASTWARAAVIWESHCDDDDDDEDDDED